MDKVALIIAGGKGKRMNSSIPKQFLPIGGIPVLMHTINKFFSYDNQIKIILVLPHDQIEYWNNLCLKYNFNINHEVREGGRTRFHSVAKNLKFIPDRCLLAIHDGVRPLVSNDTIINCFESAKRYGNGIPCTEINETLRIVNEKLSKQVDRCIYRLIQTPQVFKSKLIKEAYLQGYKKTFTDDAGVLESLGNKIFLVKGNTENIKITYEHDLIIASTLLAREKDI